MTEDEGLAKEVRKGGKAREILGNEVFQDAVKAIEEALLLGIRQSAFKDEALREKLCHRYSLLHDIVGQIQSVMDTGAMAAEQIDKKSLLQKTREFFQT